MLAQIRTGVNTVGLPGISFPRDPLAEGWGPGQRRGHRSAAPAADVSGPSAAWAEGH